MKECGTECCKTWRGALRANEEERQRERQAFEDARKQHDDTYAEWKRLFERNAALERVVEAARIAVSNTSEDYAKLGGQSRQDFVAAALAALDSSQGNS